MSTLPTQINIAELDFDQILTNLIAFMKTDPTFADYDFGGSGLRLLTRVLAYVTFYQAYYLTNAVNEAFLDTAQLRSSVASHARMLGYQISGTISARTYANTFVQLSDTSATTIVLPQNTQFSLTANNIYNFYNLQDATLTQNASTLLYEGDNILLVEGRPLQYQFTVDLTNPVQQFIIPNSNVDYTTITVLVQSGVNSNLTQVFLNAQNFLTIGPNDAVFFVQESYNGYPQLTFGNGVIGAPLIQGNIIIVSYYISRGADGNGITGPFQILSANLVGFVRGTTFTDGNTVPSSGGSDEEDINNARFIAPLVYQAQNRCVTAQDYKTLILAQVGSSIGAINVFGGEQGDPTDPLHRPVYGQVYIVVAPAVGLYFSDIVKQNIQNNIVNPNCVLGVVPNVIDPDYTYIVVQTSVNYDPKVATLTNLQLQNAIANSILTYAEQNIEKFNVTFRFSKFVTVIDDTDPSILSSLTALYLEKRIYPTLDASNSYVLNFGSPIEKNGNTSAILESTDHRFTYVNNLGVTQQDCFFYEQAGILDIAYRNSNNNIIVFQTGVGTVDIANGIVTISSFAPIFIESNEIDVRLQIIPLVTNFTPSLNQLFTIDPTEISIQLLNDATATLNEQIGFFQGGVLP